MLEILKNFEQAATRFSPVALIVPGLILVILGLFVWLGGLGFRRLVLAPLGMLVGGLGGLALWPQYPEMAGLLALAMALAAAFVQRGFAALLLGALSLSMAFVVVARPFLAESHGTLIAAGVSGPDGPRLTNREGLDVIRATAIDLLDAGRRAAGQLAAPRWAVIAAAGAGSLTLGLLFRHLGSALSCAILGTTMIFSGLVLLLVFKGSTPVTYMEHRAGFFAVVFVAMATFGTAEQLVLCRRADRNQQARSAGSKQNKRKSKSGWRNR